MYRLFLHYCDPEEDLKKKYPFFHNFKRVEASSTDFMALISEQFKPYPESPLLPVYQKIAGYSDEFTIFAKHTSDLAFVAHDKFIGKPDELPVPLVKLVSTSNTENYFFPKDRKFMGRFGRQQEILDVAMPYISVVFWEQSGYTNIKRLHVETQMDFESYLSVDPACVRKSPEEYPTLSRPEVLQNLEFLLRFVPRESPMVINADVLPALKQLRR